MFCGGCFACAGCADDKDDAFHGLVWVGVVVIGFGFLVFFRFLAFSGLRYCLAIQLLGKTHTPLYI